MRRRRVRCVREVASVVARMIGRRLRVHKEGVVSGIMGEGVTCAATVVVCLPDVRERVRVRRIYVPRDAHSTSKVQLRAVGR